MKREAIAKLTNFYKAKKYKNKKTGAEYQILCIACDTTNTRDGTPVVMYVNHSTDGPDIAFVRDLEEFKEKFERSY